jgi:hypothetical protein
MNLSNTVGNYNLTSQDELKDEVSLFELAGSLTPRLPGRGSQLTHMLGHTRLAGTDHSSDSTQNPGIIDVQSRLSIAH